ncbi:hypothetical protein BV20DRAFT_973090 [Pilatotrama ljubarskyi]|nr:hypothetical protein BV20DRAFT_973090 [Pilatotrama ljubarskyi]
MSISTGSMSSYCSCSTSEVLKTNQLEGWRQELQNKINVYEGDLNSYLTTFVPSRARCDLPLPDVKLSSSWTPEKGKEVRSYKPLIDIFNALVANFPDDKKLSFYDCHSQTIAFPFAAFADRHHKSSPDIAVTFPGQPLPTTMSSLDWSRFSMVIEAKDLADKDPFAKGNTISHADTMVQLAVSARSLMFAHGFLATFMLGVYGDTVRIARFDHSCAVASRPFSLKSTEGLRAVREFFWNFVHPWEGGPGAVVGCDPTIRKLTDADQTWVKESLGEDAEEVLQGVDLREGRWAKVWDEDDSRNWKAYIMFKLLDVNARLFSRSTMVWLGIEDTRVGHTNDATEENTEVQLRIIKEAWRQVIRTPETKFYERLKQTVPEDEWRGLPKVTHGGDLGTRDVKRWEAARAKEPWNGDDDLLELRSTFSTGSATSGSSTAPSSLFSSASSSSSFGELSDSEMTDDAQSAQGPPDGYPYPMHETYSWRLSVGDDAQPRERSHVRFVVDTVGRPLSQFKTTKELVTAMRDAIKGHQLALQYGGILHRDVSTGNILIVDRPRDDRTKGILHDYDYSSMTLVPPAGAPASASSNPPPLRPLELADRFEDIIGFKERTGTYYFMAIELLQPSYMDVCHDAHHDLESFFWVLLWIVLRHTKYARIGPNACSEIFVYGDDKKAIYAKSGWLTQSGSEPIEIPDNGPLTALLAAFIELVYDANVKQGRKRTVTPLTYEAVLEIFDTALARTDWPTDDKAIPFHIPENRTQTVIHHRVRGTLKKRSLAEDDGIEDGSYRESTSTTLHSSASGMAKRKKRNPTPLVSGASNAAAGTSSRVTRSATRRAKEMTSGGSKDKQASAS